MLKSLNAWTVDVSTGFAEMFRQVRAAGFDGIELNVDAPGHSAHSLTMRTSDAELQKIRAACEDTGLKIVSISSSLYAGKMGSPLAEEREFAKALVRKQLECAAALGADGILCVPGGQCPRIPYAQDWAQSLETLLSLRQEILHSGLFVDLENVWNGFFTSPCAMARFIDEAACPLVGAYFDVGNVVAFSWPEAWIDALGARIHHVHVKDFRRNGALNCGGSFTGLCEGDVNWPAVLAALRRAGFQGYLTGEVFKPESEREYFPYYQSVSRAMDKILAEEQEERA